MAASRKFLNTQTNSSNKILLLNGLVVFQSFKCQELAPPEVQSHSNTNEMLAMGIRSIGSVKSIEGSKQEVDSNLIPFRDQSTSGDLQKFKTIEPAEPESQAAPLQLKPEVVAPVSLIAVQAQAPQKKETPALNEPAPMEKVISLQKPAMVEEKKPLPEKVAEAKNLLALPSSASGLAQSESPVAPRKQDEKRVDTTSDRTSPAAGTGSPKTVPGMRLNAQAPGEELSYFFRATDNELLYNLGDAFYRDVKIGAKCFAFAHDSSPDSQKRSILGVASFISYFEDCRILILTHNMAQSFFRNFKNESIREEASVEQCPSFKYHCYSSHAIHYLEVSEIEARVNEQRVKNVPNLIKQLLADYDVVLVDLPPLEERKGLYSIYLPLLQLIESVTFTISLKKSRFSEIREMKQYFMSYKIKIKGSVIDRNAGKGASL